MSPKPNASPTSPANQSADERWLGLLAQSAPAQASLTAASHAFLSKLKPVDPRDAGNRAAIGPSAQLFAKLVQAGASKDEAAAEVEAQSLAKALSRRRVKMEAQVPQADEALFAKLQKRLSSP
jgi:hypothetical protein